MSKTTNNQELGGENPRRTRRGTLLIAGQFGFLIALALLPAEPTQSQVAQKASWVLLGLAVLVLIFAAKALWPSLTVRPEPKAGPFIATGVYRWIRHPMYTAVMLIGMALYLGKPSTLMMILLLALMLVMFSKATYEDAFLRAKWPQAADYQRRVGMFFPTFRSK